MTDTATTTLGDVCSDVDYGLTASASNTPVGPRFLRITDIANGHFDASTVPFVDADEGTQEKYELQSGDVVVARTGASVGSSHWFQETGEPFVFASYLIRFRARPEVNSRFIGYSLKSDSWQHYISANANSKSAQPNISATVMKNFVLHLPTRPEQDAISEVLGALDDKVAENGRIVLAADNFARELYSFRAKTAPAVPLSLLASFVNGGAYTKNASGTGRMVVRIAELNNGPSGSTVWNDISVPEDRTVHPGDLLMSWSGSLLRSRWFREEAIVNQHIFKVIPNESNPLWAVACAVDTKLEEFQAIAAGKATTMGHIKRQDLDSPVAWPEFTREEDALGSTLWDRALAAERESLQLAGTRDELLPLLMSGKITVKDAEKKLESVV